MTPLGPSDAGYSKIGEIAENVANTTDETMVLSKDDFYMDHIDKKHDSYPSSCSSYLYAKEEVIEAI